ncbi:hypothetical protein BDAP_000760 [Binucleata daphniae]
MSYFNYSVCLENIVSTQKCYYLQRYLNMINEESSNINYNKNTKLSSSEKVSTHKIKKMLQEDVKNKKIVKDCNKDVGRVVVPVNVKQCLEKVIDDWLLFIAMTKK